MARVILPLLGGAIGLVGIATSQAQTTTVQSGPNGVSGSTTVTTGPNGKPCRVVHSDEANKTGTLSSSVTAGPDGVKSSTTGGPSVTTRSANGTTSSSAASSSSGGSTMTTTGDGDCVVTVPSNKK
ncbi:glycosyl hydrolase [Methylobacterium sp. NI91]|nr:MULTISPECIES: glycosyl hydrolase [unclassified Methylobacterium]QIJ74883.1 glycosyl hydrolase [Methylobacterium sp. CLZ]QIJ79788.1 glycosyl hydrolase [Methylobacterium sp. NI91]